MQGELPDWRRAIRETAWLYEPLREFFAERSARHQGLREQLNAARMPVTVETYLARSAVLAAVAGVGGAIAGAALTWWLAASGTLASLSGVPGTGGLGRFVGANRGLVVGMVLPVALAAAFAVGAWYARYYLPGRRAAGRARKIGVGYPAAVTFMYALSRGGLDIVEILERLAADEETYGEVAREAGLVVNQMDYLGKDFMQALREASEVTPSPILSDFFSDLLSIVESGGSVESFLQDQREDAVQEARSVQAEYLERVELFAEVYVTLLVAGPLFALILLMVMGITGTSTLSQVNAIVYLGIPGGSVLALLVLDQLGAPFRQTARQPSDAVGRRPERPDDEAVAAYAERKRRGELWRRLSNPRQLFTDEPLRVLVVSVPLALAAVGLLVAAGLVNPSLSAFRAAPLAATVFLLVVPAFVALVPLAVFQELRQRRLDTIRRRFPSVLSSWASANRMGLRPSDALQIASDRADNVLARELRQVHNETEWFDDLRGALLRLALRSRTRVGTRTLRLVVEADEASGNLDETLSVAAEDARMDRELERARSRELSSYVVAALISFLVYLAILMLINEFYFEQAVAIGQQAGADTAGLPLSLQSIDAAGFRLAFIHSSLVQAVFIGLMTGKLSRGRVLAGLKYSLALLAVTVVVFGVV
ncbi:type II secretion system F family protein [Haloarcula laminariae]|uniref:type II secretion system F family protein n=1 Tax=Haloarcula laminariae TaxID=2961577 RepID=UPI0024050221|nr:type II secretion system F family protein [Halomicroarcula sp. FL173]